MHDCSLETISPKTVDKVWTCRQNHTTTTTTKVLLPWKGKLLELLEYQGPGAGQLFMLQLPGCLLYEELDIVLKYLDEYEG